MFSFFIYPAFAAKDCVHYEKLDTIVLQRKADVYSSTNSPCNAEDNLNAEYVIIEDWFRRYYGSPGLGGPPVSGLLDVGRTDGPSKIQGRISPLVSGGDSRMRGWQI